jgi:hypothetical protein
VVAVTMRHDNEIELPEVDAGGFDVVREDIRVVAGVEQDAPSADFEEPGKAPVLLHRSSSATALTDRRQG